MLQASKCHWCTHHAVENLEELPQVQQLENYRGTNCINARSCDISTLRAFVEACCSKAGVDAGQGLNITLEDGAVLAWHLQDGGLCNKSLRAFEKERIPRVCKIVEQDQVRFSDVLVPSDCTHQFPNTFLHVQGTLLISITSAEHIGQPSEQAGCCGQHHL